MKQLPLCCYRVSVKAIIFDETRTKILLFRENNGKRALPWWGLEFGHTPQEDIVRELKEEAGLKVTRVDKRPLYVVTKKKKNKDVRLVIIIYEAKVKNLNLIPSKECQELWFFSKQEAQQLERYPIAAIDAIDF